MEISKRFTLATHDSRKKNLIEWVGFLVLFLIIFNHSFAQNNRESLLLKEGTTLSCTILELNAWALTLADDCMIPIKKVSEIKTTSSLLVHQLQSYYPDVQVSEKDSVFTLSVASLSLLPWKDTYFIKRYSWAFNIMSAPREMLEFQINFIPNGFDNFIGQISISSGTDFEPKNCNVQQIHCGAGYVYTLGKTDVAVMMNLGHKSLVSSQNTKNSDIVTFLSLCLRQTIWENRFFVSIGSRYHITNIPIQGEKTRFSANLGIGASFR
jgi:hypothetical protein